MTATADAALRRRRLVVRGTLLVFLLAGLWSVAQLVSVRNELSSARREVVRAQQAVRGQRAEEARSHLVQAKQDVLRARSSARAFPLALTRPLPVVGSPVRAVDGATRAGLHVVEAGRIVASAVERFPTSGRAGIDGHDLSAFRDAAASSEADIARAGSELRQADAALDGPSGAWLPPVSRMARDLRAQVDDGRDDLDGVTRALQLLRDLAAPGTEARLLLLAQDSLELRPTGGFIGSFGVLHFKDGAVKLERYESFEALPPPNPPMDPPKYLAGALPRFWGLSNVNWWPDFPTSAEAAREMFKRQGGGEVDGVLAITEKVMARVVGVLGPIQVPGYAEPVVEKGFAERIVYEVELKHPLDQPRKKFLTLLSQQVFDRLFSLEGRHVPKVAKAIEASIASGDVQLWFADAARQQKVRGSVLAGALPGAKQGDFLMLVDANLEAGKANADVAKDTTYTVRREGSDFIATLRVRIRNEGPATIVNQGYHAFLRVYAPEGARLLADSEVDGDLGDAPDGPYRVFATYVDVAPGAEEVVTFRYRLPPSILSGRDYRLTWLRQAGTPQDELAAVVTGRTFKPAGSDRHFSVERRVLGNRVTEFLRTRAVFRSLFER